MRWKPLSVTVAALLGVLVVGELAAIMADVGDCYGLTQVQDAFCDTPTPCHGITAGTYSCFDQTYTCSTGSCNPSPCTAVVATDLREAGFCTEMPDSGQCTKCGQYVCGSGVEYQGIDENNQCQTARCNGSWSCFFCCVP